MAATLRSSVSSYSGAAQNARAPRCSKPRVYIRGSRSLQLGVRAQQGPMDSMEYAKPSVATMAEERKWESGFRSGQVRNVNAKDAAALMKSGWVMLDVRPPNEVKKARVVGAVEVPVFIPDPSNDLGSLLKQMSAFGMGGWWLGGTHMIPNTSFLQEVQAKVPKDAKVIVSCQKGLRSLAACEQLSRAGYPQVAWINGGFDSFRPGELETEGGVDIRFAGIGGMSEVLGWTEVQQEADKSAGGFNQVIKVALALLAIDALLFAGEQINYYLQQGGQ